MQHEMSSYRPVKWGTSATEEHALAVKNDIPFVTHIEEGYDEEAMLGIDIMKELKILDEYTVLIHGISLSEKDIEDIAKAKAHVVWCPTSNYFMFQEDDEHPEAPESRGQRQSRHDSPRCPAA
jgi:hypothetical protein